MARKVETPEEVDERIKKATVDAEKAATLPGYVFIDVTTGPYAGKRLQVEEAEASAAVSEGWARKLGEEAEAEDDKELSPEEQFDVAQKARQGARRLRGEKELDEDKAEDKPKDKTKDEGEDEERSGNGRRRRTTERRPDEARQDEARQEEPRERERGEGYDTRDVRPRK